jgi:hypothetical protein
MSFSLKPLMNKAWVLARAGRQALRRHRPQLPRCRAALGLGRGEAARDAIAAMKARVRASIAACPPTCATWNSSSSAGTPRNESRPLPRWVQFPTRLPTVPAAPTRRAA